jgi:hypothetical protein
MNYVTQHPPIAPPIVKYSARIFRIVYFFQATGNDLPFEAIVYAIL